MFLQGLSRSVFISILRVYQDVIYKCHHKLVWIKSENSIHKIHKGRGGIGQARGITTNSKWPYLVLNAVLGMSLGLILSWWYLDLKSILEKAHASYNCSNRSSIHDKGYSFFMVIVLSSL